VAPRDFAQRLWSARRVGGAEAVRTLLASETHSLGEIIANVSSHLEFKPDADAAEVLREEIEGECDALLEQNSQLGVIYRITPLLGLLGTVFGMIETFNDFTSAANPDIQQLSAGINVALLTTAWGLSIAIPAYIALYLLQRRISSYEQFVLPREAAAALHALLDRPVSHSRATVRVPGEA
jgi:biopolymer transport protein ExbB